MCLQYCDALNPKGGARETPRVSGEEEIWGDLRKSREGTQSL